MAEDMKNEIQDLSTKPLTPSEEPTKELEKAEGNGEADEQKAVDEKDEKVVHVVERAKQPTPPGKRPGPTTG